MKLKKFKQRDPKKIGITIFTVVCVLLVTGVFFYTSFASFQVQEDFNIIEGTVGNNGDLYFAFYVDDVISKTMPQKGDGYKINKEKTTCTKGASVEFNETDWSVKVLNMTERNTKCTLYFEKTGAGYIEDLYENGDSSLAYDETVDNNLRYIGANPNSYVSFNNELWRIIGVFNNIDDGTGNKETRIKIIRDESIGNFRWDISEIDVNSGYGINEWSQAGLMKLLNPGYEVESANASLYWNQTFGKCYIQSGDLVDPEDCDFSRIGLSSSAKEMIQLANWTTGSNGNEILDTLNVSSFYNLEHSANTGKICNTGVLCNDSFARTSLWNGFIGLMVPSDYGYATSGGNNVERETCLNTSLYEWKNLSECYTNNWLYKNTYQWTITAAADVQNADLIIRITPEGIVYGGYYTSETGNSFQVYPSTFLKSSVKIVAGIGSREEPYVITL